MCVLPCGLELKWFNDKSLCEVCTCFVCVCVDNVVRQGVEPWKGCNFILDEGLKISCFGIIRQREQFGANFL